MSALQNEKSRNDSIYINMRAKWLAYPLFILMLSLLDQVYVAPQSFSDPLSPLHCTHTYLKTPNTKQSNPKILCRGFYIRFS